MPMIDVYAAAGTFGDKHALAKDLAAAVMKWEQVPNLALFRNNTAAFIHELPADSLSNVVGDTDYVLLTGSRTSPITHNPSRVSTPAVAMNTAGKPRLAARVDPSSGPTALPTAVALLVRP